MGRKKRCFGIFISRLCALSVLFILLLQSAFAADVIVESGNINISNILTVSGFKMPSGGQISYVLTSDANGQGFWQAPGGGAAGGGWFDAGNVVYLLTSSDKVGIGTTAPSSELNIVGQLTINSSISDKIVFRGTSAQVTPHTIYLDDSKGLRIWDSVNNELMRVTNDGKVGIGTTNPDQRLIVNDGSAANAVSGGARLTVGNYLSASRANGIQLATLNAAPGASNSQSISFFFRNNANTGEGAQADIVAVKPAGADTADLSFRPSTGPGANTERMIIKSSGSVGIGTPSPVYLLDINGNMTSTVFYDRQNPGYYLDPASTSVLSTVYASVYYYNSDEELKKEIKQSKGLEVIRNLKGVSFKWKDSGKPGLGFIAQDVEKVLPELVTSNDNTKSVNYAGIIAPLVEASKELDIKNSKNEAHIKELDVQDKDTGYKIAQLQGEIANLKKEIEDLKSSGQKNND